MITQRFISIKTQFVLITLVLVAMLSALWGWGAWKTERNLLYSSLEREGQQMLNSLSSPIINALLYEEMGVIEEGGLLDNFIEEIMQSGTLKVVHAFVTNQNDKVLVHNQYTEYGKTYDDQLINTAKATGRYQAVLRSNPASSGQILDMAMPLHIYGKSWGVLRVGVSTEPLQKQLHLLAQRILLISLGLFLSGVLVSYLIARSMARPLERLAASMQVINTDNLEVELPPERPDEIGTLQRSFRSMLERLQRSEAERTRAVSQLIQSEKLASLGKIVAGVAHEVNNPLGAINTCLYNIEQGTGNQTRNLEIIKQGIQRIERIVRQLNDFSRTASLEREPVQSDSFFRETLDFARLALKRFDVRITSEDHCRPPIRLWLDKGKIQQVLLNLLVNAASASSPGQSVELRATTTETCYQLTVTDYGSGIPAELQEAVFDIFFTTKPAGEGTGIGLAICKSIIELHQGAIQLHSIPGKTVFTVCLPLTVQETLHANL